MNWHRPPICSKKWANIWSSLLFIVLSVVLGYYDHWLSNLPLALGLSIVLRQLLLSKLVDAVITLVIFTPLYIFVRFQTGWNVLIPMPFLFVGAAVIIICREIFEEWKDQQTKSPRK